MPRSAEATKLDALAGAQRLTLRDARDMAKPGITVFNVLMAALGMVMAPAMPDMATMVFCLLGTTGVVAAANVLNCFWERETDRLMVRTAKRPLPAGRTAPWQALLLGLVGSAVSLALLWFAVNPLASVLGAAGLLSYVLIYTPMKRISPTAVLVGAFPGATPPLIGWAAAVGYLDAQAVSLFAVLFVWQIPHFIAISIFNMHDYAQAGIRTVAAVRGEFNARIQLVGYSALLLPVSMLLTPIGLTGPFYAGAALIMGLVLLAWALRGLFEGADWRWAKGYFLVTLAYLPLLFGVMLIDRM